MQEIKGLFLSETGCIMLL